ncbi:MAG: zinc ribbon domain-containing protein [Deltaproteobacteria bacterium]|nr:zinc ribbon domain-containing protein [Deltaproteobacteria bacterium]
MPIFEFHCTHCDKEFEKLVFGSDPQVECPFCGQKDVKKLMSVCAFKTDYHNFMSVPSSSKSSKSSSSCSSCSATSCSSCG